MYLLREVVSCKPGKVREMKEKFMALNGVMERLGVRPYRLLTDVSGGPFWTLVAETEVESLDTALETESRVMAEKDAQTAMSGYHDLVMRGHREFFRIES